VAFQPLYEGMTPFAELITTLTGRGFDITGFFPISIDDELRLVEADCVMVSRDVAGPLGALHPPQLVTNVRVGSSPVRYGKGIKGRKQRILADTVCKLPEVIVHAASVQDRDGAKLLFAKLTDALIEPLLSISGESELHPFIRCSSALLLPTIQMISEGRVTTA